MKELLEVLREVKERIDKYREELQRSEALTRYVLIDPVLRVLGWNTEDPSQVKPEFSTGSGIPDYALFAGSNFPLIMVEAKALGSSLKEAEEKGFKYCWKNKVPFYVITDGDRWIIHDLREMGGKEIGKVSVSKDPVGETARTLLALWRPSMPAVHPAPKPMVEESMAEAVTKTPKTSAKEQGYASLLEIKKALKEGTVSKVGPAHFQWSKPPQEILFPNNKSQKVKSWTDVFRAVVMWAEEKIKDKVPIRYQEHGSFLVAWDATEILNPMKVGKWFVKRPFSAQQAVSYAEYLLEKIGINPIEVKLKF